VHDAVVTVNLLAQPLRDGILRAQRMIHHRFPLPVARGRLAATRAPTPP
jgi:hypothetical protein